MFSITQFAVNNSADTLVFSGVGKVKIVATSSGSSLKDSSGAQDFQLTSGVPVDFEFTVPSDVYARSSSSGFVKVVHWY